MLEEAKYGCTIRTATVPRMMEVADAAGLLGVRGLSMVVAGGGEVVLTGLLVANNLLKTSRHDPHRTNGALW